MDRVSLFEEYRLIERSESEVNSVWKGAHILLFFLAFVFGSFCTFCFHMLMYLFDDKCVLFPKLQSLTSGRQDIIYEIIPVDKDTADTLPVDFLSSHWVERSVCYLPTYVPLVSGIFGLVWTTMFLMCSTGSRTLTGLQRPWRVLPPVFIFSLAMGGISVYSSIITQCGLDELCLKLGEITGCPTCTYTVNVATLAYERRIRGVYQAIRLTVISAWLHTTCWILSALLALTRVILAVDFQLVRVNVELIGDIDKMLERHETQIRTISPDIWFNEYTISQTSLPVPLHTESKVHFTDIETHTTNEDNDDKYYNDVLYLAKVAEEKSEQGLVPIESHKLARIAAYQNLPKDLRFIVKMIYDLLLTIDLPESEPERSSSDDFISSDSAVLPIVRQLGQEKINKKKKKILPAVVTLKEGLKDQLINPEEAKETAKEMRKYLQDKFYELYELPRGNFPSRENFPSAQASTSKKNNFSCESSLNITEDMKRIINAQKKITDKTFEESKVVKKSNLKHASIQTDKRRKKRSVSPTVKITEPDEEDNEDESTETTQDVEKETQTSKKKEKQD